jgi:putative membrane-bound dehydrogenase-like protein
MKWIATGIWVLSLTGANGMFPEPHDTEKNLSVRALDPDAAAAGFAMPEGFRVGVFAAEPEVRNPIALTWDRRGRMWVAENFTYAEKGVRYDLALRDRVLILEDADQDGVAESQKVFIDTVQRLTSVEVGRGGVWLMCPPQLLFVPDADGDDEADGAPEVVLDGFEVGESSHHNLANGLRWGPDGWLYGRCGHSCPAKIGRPGAAEGERVPMKGGIWRYHPERGVAEVVVHGTTNPWGHDWDRHGEGFFINVVNGHLWHLIPGAHCKESFGAPLNPRVYERLDTIADHWHFDTKGKWSDSRDGAANALGGGHAHVGMMIYQGSGWPEGYRDRLFTLNLHGRRANVERLERWGSGYAGRHEPDMLVAADPWFRGVEIRQGPDGSAYVLDWSDTGECHEHTGVHRQSGRIYRVSHGEPPKAVFEDLKQPLTLAAVERLIRVDNPWWERQMRLKLAEEAAPEGVMEALESWAREPKGDVRVRLRALWSWEAAGDRVEKAEARRALLLDLLKDEEEPVRAWAVRLLVDDRPLDRGDGGGRREEAAIWDAEIEARLVERAAKDESGLVRLHLASALQRLPVARRAELASALMSRREDATDAQLPLMVWFGLMPLVDKDVKGLVRVAERSLWPETLKWISRAMAEKGGEGLEQMSALAARTTEGKRRAILKGFGEGLAGTRKAAKPEGWEAVLKAAEGEDESAVMARELSVVFGDGRALEAVMAVARDDSAAPEQRAAAVRSLVEARAPGLRELCLKLLETRGLAVAALRGLALFDEAGLGEEMLKRWGRYGAEERAAVVETLVSRPAWAAALLEAAAEGKVAKGQITAAQARRIAELGDSGLKARLEEVWGVVKAAGGDKKGRIEALKQELRPEVPGGANLGRGRKVYQQVCLGCHVLYGEGGKVGPDLTGSGRASLDYLLENLVDPGAVVAADYRMTVVTLRDGRVLAGMVSESTEKTMTLRMVQEETRVERSAVVKAQTLPDSMMPEGLLEALSAEQRRDLVGYLMHPTQVAAEE